jgi:hypothetical protein
MDEAIIEVTIGIGLSILVLLIISLIVIFVKYKRIKLIEKPNFNYSQYQVKAGSTYFIFPVHIKEKDTNPKLVKLKHLYNKLITFWWIIIIALIFVTLILVAISKLYN